MITGIPFIISAPSGAGKTSLVNALVDALPNLRVSISHTTRSIRPGEKEGIDYHFVSQTEFEKMIAQDAFLEYAKVFDHCYGTSRAWLKEELAAGHDVLLEIDWQGAQQLRQELPSAVSIFILPPSLHILLQRLKERGQDNEAVIEKRMQQARNEISHYSEFDYLVVNDDFKSALADLLAIIRSQHLHQPYHGRKLAHLLANLLA